MERTSRGVSLGKRLSVTLICFDIDRSRRRESSGLSPMERTGQKLDTCVHWWVVALDIEPQTSLAIGGFVIIVCPRGTGSERSNAIGATCESARVKSVYQNT